MVAFLFPGQGSQEVGMGQDLFSLPQGKEVLAEAKKLGWGKPVPDLTAEELAHTAVAQPAIFLVEWAAFLAAKNRKDPEAVAGHSLGEFAALAAAEVLSWPQAFQLVLLRGELMEEEACKQPGGMTAVLGLPLEVVEGLAWETRCFVASVNAPGQVVLAGELRALAQAEKLAQGRGGKGVRLAVSGAFHSPLMAQAAKRFAETLEEIVFRAPKIPFVSSVTGDVEKDPPRIKDILGVQMTSPVRWAQAVETLAGLGVEEAWEIGPGSVLTRLGKRITTRVRFRSWSDVWGNV
ncbi:MAG: ACP S-malonyltransferase [Candidatus Bipolaricaulaceae bacterium]